MHFSIHPVLHLRWNYQQRKIYSVTDGRHVTSWSRVWYCDTRGQLQCKVKGQVQIFHFLLIECIECFILSHRKVIFPIANFTCNSRYTKRKRDLIKSDINKNKESQLAYETKLLLQDGEGLHSFEIQLFHFPDRRRRNDLFIRQDKLSK